MPFVRNENDRGKKKNWQGIINGYKNNIYHSSSLPVDVTNPVNSAIGRQNPRIRSFVELRRVLQREEEEGVEEEYKKNWTKVKSRVKV